MLGADSTLSSRMIANGLPTFSCVTRPKRRAPAVLKRDRDDRLAVLVEALLGVDQLVARHHHPALDRDRRRCRRPCGSTWLPGGARPCGDLRRVGGQVDQLELEPRGLADQRLERFGILDARAPGPGCGCSPWLMTVISLVPCGSMRRRTTSRATVIASFSACADARFGRGQHDAGRIDHLDVPVARCRSGPTGWVSVRSRSTAASTWVGSRTMNDSRPPAVEMSPISIRGRRGAARSRPCLPSPAAAAWRRRAASASSSSWLPPARSRPRLICGARQPARPAVGQRRAGDQAGDGEAGCRARRSARPPRPSSAGNRASRLVVGRLGAAA